jgi:hypothetical protein
VGALSLAATPIGLREFNLSKSAPETPGVLRDYGNGLEPAMGGRAVLLVAGDGQSRCFLESERSRRSILTGGDASGR